MWGFGGRCYWGRKEREGGKRIEGIAVLFVWMSVQERNVKSFVDLYSSLGWDCLVCHSQFLNMFFPEKAASLAFDILNELVKELRIRPCPVVFVAFSGGPKACMHTVLQIIEGKLMTQCNLDDCQLVRGCISGYVYDSSPVDFTTSDLGTRFILHPTVLKMAHPPRLLSWITNSIASSLDALFLSRFESQRSEYWQTLYSSASMGAPYLILYSENDDLAPSQIICNFAQRLRELGSNVKLVEWHGSPHVGHYHNYPIDYKAAVTELLGKAALVFLQRTQGNGMGSVGLKGEPSNSIFNSRETALRSGQSFRGLPHEASEHLLSSSSMESRAGRDVKAVQAGRKEGLIHLASPPSISAHGVLGGILFDACVPNNVEGWELKRSGSLIGPPFASARRHSGFNPIKCFCRSRL